MSLYKLCQILKGGPGSGHRGHAGRPGKRGGGASSGVGSHLIVPEPAASESELRNQAMNALEGSKVGEAKPFMLNYNGNVMPVYGQVGKVTKGNAPIHMETLQKIDVGTGKRELAKTYYKIQGNGKLVDAGYDLISKDQAQTWLSDHENGILH